MTPSDIIGRDRLADAVCHSEQMDIWADEMLQAVVEWLRDPEDYDDKIALIHATKVQIRSLIESAFSHPELLGLPSSKGGD